MKHHQSSWKDREREKMLDFLSVGLVAASNPNNDPGEAQIAVLPKNQALFQAPHIADSCCSNFRNKSSATNVLPLTGFLMAMLLHHGSRSTQTQALLSGSHASHAQGLRLWETFSRLLHGCKTARLK